VGSLAEEEQMNQTPNAQHPSLDVEACADGTTSNIEHRTSNILWRIIDLIVGAMFIFAGIAKILNLDQLIADFHHLRFASAFFDFGNLSLAEPAEFAHDINNFRILPWIASVALAFYLPWLEILCGLGLVFRVLYRGALSVLIALIVVFTLAITAAKIRGLDITCGCFGHATQHWSLAGHLATNLSIVAALVVLWFLSRSTRAA
jgi:uncharacterized membrane protein YphA (DoxX/SURF4 family)